MTPILNAPTMAPGTNANQANQVKVTFSGTTDTEVASTLSILDRADPKNVKEVYTQPQSPGPVSGTADVLLTWGKERVAIVRLCTEDVCVEKATPSIAAGAPPTLGTFRLANMSEQVHDPYLCDQNNNFKLSSFERCGGPGREYLVNGRLPNVVVDIDWRGAPQEEQVLENMDLCRGNSMAWRPPGDKNWDGWHTATGDCAPSFDTIMPASMIRGRFWQPRDGSIQVTIRGAGKEFPGPAQTTPSIPIP